MPDGDREISGHRFKNLTSAEDGKMKKRAVEELVKHLYSVLPAACFVGSQGERSRERADPRKGTVGRCCGYFDFIGSKIPPLP